MSFFLVKVGCQIDPISITVKWFWSTMKKWSLTSHSIQINVSSKCPFLFLRNYFYKVTQLIYFHIKKITSIWRSAFCFLFCNFCNCVNVLIYLWYIVDEGQKKIKDGWRNSHGSFQLYVYSVRNQVRTCQAKKSLDIAKSFAATHNLVEKSTSFPTPSDLKKVLQDGHLLLAMKLGSLKGRLKLFPFLGISIKSLSRMGCLQYNGYLNIKWTQH